MGIVPIPVVEATPKSGFQNAGPRLIKTENSFLVSTMSAEREGIYGRTTDVENIPPQVPRSPPQGESNLKRSIQPEGACMVLSHVL